ncbi:hypothetical protein [Paraflavitalea sp. CAU 1676]|uniref:hypothetical protein n=1 Tax=Paraflavitalea sp. CAU 1676 TaxID=3032598 RepID=UPI0023DCBF82|nr:hypothetical protein [Paraflavitalea sp. CAU 1676]MDF2187259.1 hypothetical protein [Paraflavitalea sp. CAU 1676]
MKPYLLASSLLLLIAQAGLAQTTAYPYKIAMQRVLWHENIDKQQIKLFASINKSVPDESVSLQITDATGRHVDELQEQIETDSILSSQSKIKYLRNVESTLQQFSYWRGQKDFPATSAPALIKGLAECIELDRKGQSIEPVIESSDYGVARMLVDGLAFSKDNPGMANSRVILTRKYLGLHPDEILLELRKQPNLPFADSILKVAAHRDVRKFYDYAQARGPLSNRIASHPDTLVRTIGQMAGSRNGQLYFPFLDNLIRGKITIREIDSVKDNDFSYFRLLVRTRIEYAGRLLPPVRDTATELNALTEMMARKARQLFVREINALHDVNDLNVRFRSLERLTPQELYYVAVLSEDEIYTSSYVSGVYPRIFQRMTNPRGDSLLMSVNGDYFRKFIKMAAGYNTLNHFLGTMGKEEAETLMKAFVIGLERKKNDRNDDLEDAVDVADSYSSIMDKNKELAGFILNEVKWNYDKNVQDNNKRGVVIYKLLKILFESADTASRKMDLSTMLGIPSIYAQDYKSLTDDSGRVVQQVFFYGDEDKDGQNSFVNFMGMFRGKAEWKIDDKPEWVSIRSTRGKPVYIYANKPLYKPEEDLDEKAQVKLIEYLDSKNLRPTVVVHRGHSYHLPYTLKKLAPTARIVVLGSCGGYNNLNEVLTICRDAHIISSKQVGTKTVNEPILEAINANLVAGRNIDWINMWKELSGRFRTGPAKEKFDDYIPPYKNLGAIFIKAYRNAMGE